MVTDLIQISLPFLFHFLFINSLIFHISSMNVLKLLVDVKCFRFRNRKPDQTVCKTILIRAQQIVTYANRHQEKFCQTWLYNMNWICWTETVADSSARNAHNKKKCNGFSFIRTFFYSFLYFWFRATDLKSSQSFEVEWIWKVSV